MCELFGMSCQKPDRAIHSLASLREYSIENPDGWGIAYYQNGKAIVKREPVKAKISENFNDILQNSKSKVIIAHIRLKSQGELCTENCHPFKREINGRDWIFAHNGTIKNIPQHTNSIGKTDSENVFNELMDDVVSYRDKSIFHGIYPGLISSIKDVMERYSRNITFNFFLSDGSILYIFNHYPNKSVFISIRGKPYGDAVVVSTQKLYSEDKFDWNKIPEDKVIVISDGRVLVVSDPI